VRVWVVVALAACARELPPPARPTTDAVPHPAVALGPPAEGDGSVLIDTVGGQADVYDITDLPGKIVCTTPCDVHLHQGLHSLQFTSVQAPNDWRGEGRITVGAVQTAYRYALGARHASLGALAAGVTAATFGVIFLPIGLADGSSTETGVGVGLTVLGAVILYLARPDEQVGAGVQWTPNRVEPANAP
jgi:hypothetical protein